MDRESGAFSHDREESNSRAEHRHRKQNPHYLSSGFRGRFSCRCRKTFFPDTDDFGRVFRNNAVMSAMAYRRSPPSWACVVPVARIFRDVRHILMTEGSGLFLAGPALVQAAIGQKTSAEDLGGAKMHSQISGTVDFREPDDDACIARIRALVDKIGAPNPSPFSHTKARERSFSRRKIYESFRAIRQAVRHARNHRAHRGRRRIREYRAESGETLLCGYSRIGGWAVGIVANQKKHVQTLARGSDQKRMEFGGVIYTESAEKAARFILDCNQNRIPLIFLHDVTDSWWAKTRSGAASFAPARKW